MPPGSRSGKVDETDQRGAIAFAERILELLDEGRYTATYKYALLLALIDVCLEYTQTSGASPETVTTRQLAEKIIEIYWPHTAPFAGRAGPGVLRQNTGGQAEIVSDIQRFRQKHSADPSLPRWQSRLAAPKAYDRLARLIEWKLIEMPLPRLQIMGQSHLPFIYDLHWDQQVRRKDVARYLSGDADTFDNRVLLKPNVGEYLLQLNGLLRPLIQTRWAAMVAQLNHLEESQLEAFLFGADRIQTAKIRVGLWEIQARRCFYCNDRVSEPTRAQVDHFIPWSRYPDNGLDNLVVTDTACNISKSSSLPAAAHVTNWVRRLDADSPEYRQLVDLAAGAAWERVPGRSCSVARGIYLHLRADAKLWLQGKEFVTADRAVIEAALSVCSR